MKRLKIIGLIFIIIITYNTIRILDQAGVFTSIEPVNAGKEAVIASPPGIEDIAIDNETGFAYLSSEDRRRPGSRGDIYLMNLNDSTDKIVNLTAGFPKKDFRPHGISFLKTPEGKKLLFVISHGDNKNVVEQFEIKGDSLKHIKNYSSSQFISPNDLLAIGQDQFYITNDHTRKKDLLRTLGDFIQFPSGNVLYYDGTRAKQVSEGIPYANGINISLDKTTIFVTSTTTNKILAYEPAMETYELKPVYSYDLGYSPDNIDVDSKGHLWIACHPKTLRFLKHVKKASERSPSAVLEVIYQPQYSGKFSQNLQYLNDGDPLSGSSVAAVYDRKQGKTVLVGSVFESKILKFERDKP